jgi:hypothetical protein
VGAMIRLGNCFDLLDPANVKSLKALHAAMMQKWHQTDAEIPENGNQHKNLDYAIFNHYGAERTRTAIRGSARQPESDSRWIPCQYQGL